MKKLMMTIALFVIAFASQAQTKFHDVEVNEATGPVKKMIVNVMGREQTYNFTKEGKMQIDGLSDAVYDADGYLQSVKLAMMGQEATIKYKWENGKIASQSTSVMGQEIKTKRTYNEKGAPSSEIVNVGGQEMSMPYTDYKYDDHGNWISRKTTIMGQEMEQKRTIEYYE